MQIEGLPPNEGVLAIYHDGEWGSICSEGFGGNDAKVACRQLNRTWEYAEYFTGFSPERPSAPIWLSNLECTGEERSLLGCRKSPWGQTFCDHSSDVSVRCRGKYILESISTCNIPLTNFS